MIPVYRAGWRWRFVTNDGRHHHRLTRRGAIRGWERSNR